MAELDRQILTPWLRNGIIACWALLTAAFLLVTFYYIFFHHVEPLSRDQWHMYDALFGRGLADTSLGTVSGHRHILAFLLYAIDMEWFDGRNRFLITINWLLNGMLITLLCSQAWHLPLSRLARILLCSWIVVLLTWLLNIALLGWGFNGINNYLSIVPVIIALFCLHHAVHQARHALTLVACLLGILATLSFANGILVWPTALICLYLWRAPARFYSWILAATACACTTYALLPGAEAAQQALKWPGILLIQFPVMVMGGPLYHLMRSWHIISNETLLTAIASVFGLMVTVFALCRFGALLQRRKTLTPFQSLCIALMCLGAGSCLMLSMGRQDEYLDFTVDRFQIFALLVWIGTSGLYISTASAAQVRRWEILFVIFPLLAFPAQLDWGARLAEYRTRVDMSLLAYQVYLPVKEDAKNALHWNWENKLPAFFSVLEHIRHERKNIFHDGYADHIGKAQTINNRLPVCDLTIIRPTPILASHLLGAGEPATFNRLPSSYQSATQSSDQPLGQRWFFSVTEQHSIAEKQWNAGLLLDKQQHVRGIVHRVNHSQLPRSTGRKPAGFNAYGVLRMDNITQSASTLLLLHEQTPLCQYDL